VFIVQATGREGFVLLPPLSDSGMSYKPRSRLMIRAGIHNTSFSSQLTNGLNKLECWSLSKPFQHSVVERSSSLGQFLVYDENEV